MGGENTLDLVEGKIVLPPRFYTKGDEPDPDKSFGVSSTTITLLDALKQALRPDEWDEIWQSELGVFLKFHELNISQASRLGHFLLTWQVACNKRNYIWSLIGVTPIRFSLYEFEYITSLNCEYVEELMTPAVEMMTEMVEFWEMLGTDVSVGPRFNSLLHACGRCGAWERENRLRLGYLAILANFIDAKPHTQPTDVNLARLVMDLERFVSYPWGRVAFKIVIKSVKEADITKTYSIKGFSQVLQSWSYFALPKFASEYGSPFRNSEEALPLLAYGGSKGRKSLRSGMLKQHIDAGINLLRKRCHEHPEWFRSTKLAFIDATFTYVWMRGYGEFEKTADAFGRGRILPGGAHDLYTGQEPDSPRSGKVCGIGVDEIYTSLNIGSDHWVAMMISIPRHIYIWDSIISCNSDLEIEKAIQPFCEMFAYVMNNLYDEEDKYLHPVTPYGFSRAPASETPQCVSGDFGVYLLKYIEWHALGVPFSPLLMHTANVKHIRKKLTVEIYHELGIKGTELRGYKGLDTYDSTF